MLELFLGLGGLLLTNLSCWGRLIRRIFSGLAISPWRILLLKHSGLGFDLGWAKEWGSFATPRGLGFRLLLHSSDVECSDTTRLPRDAAGEVIGVKNLT